MLQEEKEKSSLGTLIDASAEEFVTAISEYNVGSLSNMRVMLEQVYEEFKARKDLILILDSKTISDEEKEKAVKGLYAEMLKIEEKCTILVDRTKELTPKVFDAEKK